MASPSLLLCLLLALGSGIDATQYTISQTYSGTEFFNHWDFALTDPSGGWNTYVNASYAHKHGYVSATESSAYVGVDHTSVLDPNGPGRNAIRIVSRQVFNKGLFIGDFSHMPQGCGLWPAFWMVGPDWPANGEVDIIEGVNNPAGNQMSAHTSDGCVIAGEDATATFVESDCYQPTTNSGCYFVANGTDTYGAGFNSKGGGVYALEWTDNFIDLYFFTRTAIPSNIVSNKPNTATWGRPISRFAGSGCAIDQHFADMQLILNIDFCGPWASPLYASSGCPGSSCIDYVAATPAAFKNAYWEVNSIKVFNAAGTAASAQGNAAEPSPPSASCNSETPLASTESVYLPDAAMGAPSSPVLAPPTNAASA